jgi:DNA-binding SARP family transcriptional activator
MLLPQVMRPLPAAAQPGCRTHQRSVHRIAEAPFSVMRGPPGSYVAEWLAGALEEWGRWQSAVWVRPRDTRPAALARLLSSACHHRWSPYASDGERELPPEEVPVAPLDETIRRSPDKAVIVLELGGHGTRGLDRLVESIRPAVADRGISLLAVAEGRFHPAFRPAFRSAQECRIKTTELIDPCVLEETLDLPSRQRDRLLKLFARRVAIAHDLLDAALTWPPEAVIDALNAGQGYRSILGRLTANLLDLCGPARQEALEVCLATGYWHPQLTTHPVSAAELRPWVVPLEHQWGWLRPIWARSLQCQLNGWVDHRRHPYHRPTVLPTTLPPTLPTTNEPPPPPPPRAERARAPTAPPRAIVEARLLGAFEFRVDGVAVTKWNGARGTSVLRYLLSRPRHACSRDELLEEFWPDVAPQAARNRLQVAVSGLRRALLEVTSLPVIEYADGGYRVSPALRVDVDVKRFERAVSAARSTDRAGDVSGAAAAYGDAVRLYRGDFASDAPYEQWTLLPRESLRITYLDALDRLSRIELSVRQLDACIATSHRILEVDPCREDAHQLLMRCYAAQGRVYQALRQYDFCCRVLRATLEVEPSPQTTKLYHAIRAGSRLSPR